MRAFSRAPSQRPVAALLSEEQFLVRLREAIRLSERWVEIAPSPTAVVSEHADPVADIAARSAA